MSKTEVISASLRTELHSAQSANTQPKPNGGFVDLHDFVFGDGENLASLKLHYLTLGRPRRDASEAIVNGVLLLHGTADFDLPIRGARRVARGWVKISAGIAIDTVRRAYSWLYEFWEKYGAMRSSPNDHTPLRGCLGRDDEPVASPAGFVRPGDLSSPSAGTSGGQ